jgi:TolA-binding protein
MEGLIVEAIISAIHRYSSDLILLEISLVILILVLLIGTWLYNRKKYQNLKHQIPASVVKSYLDSIIQNSTALKSSLFRGNLELGEGVPSVVPLSNLPGANLGEYSAEENAQKDAEISRLRSELNDKRNVIKDLEGQLDDVRGNLKQAQARIAELEAMLKAKGQTVPAAPVAADDTKLKAELASITKERDELLERLREYEIIEDDLANLKRLQQENEQLRKALEARGIDVAQFTVDNDPTAPKAKARTVEAPIPAAPVIPEVAAEEVFDMPDTPAPVEESVEAMPEEVAAAAAPDMNFENAAKESSSEDDSDKSPEDLLSEFEKMLG